MKREALNHPKMLDLASRLDCSLATAIGHVTLLINWVADFAIRGDVGKWPDGAIARGCGFTVADTTVATTVVTAFVDAGWLDRHDEHRLILHDWPDHAERWVRAKLAATNQSFLACYSDITKSDTTVDTVVDTVVDTPPRDQTKPNQTEPNRTNPKSLTLPKLINSERNRKQLADWLTVRSQSHQLKPPISEISWEATLQKNNHWSESQWFDALRLSTEVASVNLCDPTRPKPNGKPKKDNQYPPMAPAKFQ